MQNISNIKGSLLPKTAVKLFFTISETGYQVESGIYESKDAADKAVEMLDGHQIIMKNGIIVNVEENVVPETKPATLN